MGRPSVEGQGGRTGRAGLVGVPTDQDTSGAHRQRQILGAKPDRLLHPRRLGSEKQLRHAPEADRRVYIRRVTIDLTGMLPTPEEVEAFVKDNSSNAYEKLVDRLLASPRYGERWGRHWLDVVGYAESSGYESNRPRLNAWHYRDWVIRSLNEKTSLTLNL